jgi:uncharacterized protein (TIGR00251 family)
MSAERHVVAKPVVLRVRVMAGSRQSGIVGRLGSAWKLRVRAPAERGRANDEVVRLLGSVLDVPHAGVRIARGHGSADKLVEIEGLSCEEAERRLAARAS